MTPVLTHRDDQPYVAIRRSITMGTFPEVADRLPEVFGWLGRRGIAPAGPPFFRYAVIDMERELQIEAGVPVATPVAGDDTVLAGTLPAGRYATVTHVGHPEQLLGVTRDLLAWAEAEGLRWDMRVGADGEHWTARLEELLTDPAEEPDMNKWSTRLLFRLAD